jgi:hypothetical protein
MNSKIKSKEASVIHNNIWNSSKQTTKAKTLIEEELMNRKDHLPTKNSSHVQTDNQTHVTYYQMETFINEQRTFMFGVLDEMKRSNLCNRTVYHSKDKFD